MDFRELVERLNQIASNSVTFKDLQAIRVKLKGLAKPKTYNIFSKQTIFDDDVPYAFHSGGRSEFQFNVGVEYYQDQELFRYGLGFSLQANQSQPDPKNALTPKIRAFNSWFRLHPGMLDDLKLWHYKDETTRKRSQDYSVREIPDSWIVWENFIFIGRYFIKTVEEVTESDLFEMIRLFDQLMPVYEYVESNYRNFTLPIAGERIARLCWNDNGWVYPSGPYGKSTHPDTHEHRYGYGHEEWLGDVSKTIDGYHYGFLEPVRGTESDYGKKYNIDLYTFDARTRKRFLVGRIDNAEIIDPTVAEAVTVEYRAKGWYHEMEAQVTAAGANPSGFFHWQGVDLFNIRFRPADLHFYSEYRETDDSSIAEVKRYTFLYKKQSLEVKLPVNGVFMFTPDGPESDEPESANVERNSYDKEPGLVEIRYLHKKIRNELKTYFVQKFGNCIGRELPTGYSTLIDLVRKEGTKYIFYEIKTYNNLKLCIRGALGQLMEYSHWPDSDIAYEMIIVSHNKINDQAKWYLDRIRKKYSIPLYYQQFVWEEAYLSEKY